MKRVLIILALTLLAQKNPVKRIHVSLRDQRLVCWQGARQVCSFPVSTGRDRNPTPAGSFAIETKTPDLGNIFDLDLIQLGPSMRFIPGSLIAIHGWPRDFQTGRWMEQPEDVGRKRLSDGCVMLLRRDMEWLYRWAEVGTPVEIGTN